VGAGVGDSDLLEVGDWVLAIGSPFQYTATVSAGIISAKNRPIKRIQRGRLLQTDAAINPGNSGGPMIDLDGNVIGISTAIATRNGGYQGIGFAIPINNAKWIADELDQHKKVRRAAMGVSLLELKPKYAKQFKKKPFMGVLVYQINKGSVAEVAGFELYDVILEFAGERVRSPATLQEVIERTPIGSVQEVKVDRDGETVLLQVELATVDDPTPQVKPEPEVQAESESDEAEIKTDSDSKTEREQEE
jgi:serine protease Do